MSFRRNLTESEVTLAFVIGGGMALIMIGFMLGSIQSGANSDPSRLNVMMALGAILFVGGTIAWLMIVHPWQFFDDWSVPAYTGHDHGPAHEVHEDDLTTIPGIDNKARAVLNAIGIHTYLDLAKRNPEDLDRIVHDAGLRVHGSTSTWIDAAKAEANKVVAPAEYKTDDEKAHGTHATH